MGIFAGVWIDDKQAVTVILGKESLDMSIVESHAKSPSINSGGHRQVIPHLQQDVVAEDHRQPEYAAQMTEYFNKIYRRIKMADELVLIGPGKTRKQFINFLMQQRSPIRLRECIPGGLMSNSDIARHVCRVFNRAYF